MSTLCHSIGHRYLVAGMCCSALALTTMNQLLFSFLLNELIYHQRSVDEEKAACPATSFEDSHTPGMEEFLWGSQVQAYISAGLEIGYAMARLPAGLAADKLGAKTLFGFATFVSGVCTLLTPLCARTSPYVMLVNRMVMGVFLSVQDPCMAWMAVRWFPFGQVSLMLSIMYSGYPLGVAIRLYLTQHMLSYYWTTFFYVFGILAILQSYLWQMIMWDDPFEHPFISMKELELLVDRVPMYALDFELDPGWSWPWKAMLTSRSVWSLACAYLGLSWALNFASIVLPAMYFPRVHRYDFMHHPNSGLFMGILVIVTMIAAGAASDRLVVSKMYSVTHITKAYYAIGSIGSSLLFIGMAHAGCKLTTAFIYYAGANACLAIAYWTFAAAAVAIAPNFAGAVVVLTTLPGALTTPLQFALEKSMTAESTITQWKTVTYMNGAIAMFATAVFLKTGRCALLPWNKPAQDKKKSTLDINGFNNGYDTGTVAVSVEPKPSVGVTPQLSQTSNTGLAPIKSLQKMVDVMTKKNFPSVPSKKSLLSLPRRKQSAMHWRELIQSELSKQEPKDEKEVAVKSKDNLNISGGESHISLKDRRKSQSK